ncbi:MAG: hypothetical protein QXU18_01755 [Thermoplasmatales archaeon]
MASKKCTLFSKYDKNENLDLSFSTTWCRDRLFTSENPNDILKLYDTFSNRDELIQWMKERPKGRAEIIEVEGDKEIIVVITTADFNGKYAKECRENIFKGLHIIFVESGYPRDPYFNYAHNCNIGIKKAMEYNPKWIVLSNDDMKKVDDTKTLKSQLVKIDFKKSCIVYLEPPGKYYSYWARIGRPSSIRYIIYQLNKYLRLKVKIEKRLGQILGLKFLILGTDFPYRLLFGPEDTFRNVGAVAIFSGKFAEENNGSIFDETYINGIEDVDFSLRAANSKVELFTINYRIGTYIGATLGGFTSNRTLREIANLAYFNYKISNGLLLIPDHSKN